jgi:hypothetical protein
VPTTAPTPSAGGRALLLACFTVVGSHASCETNVTEFRALLDLCRMPLGGTCFIPKAKGCGYAEAMPLQIISARFQPCRHQPCWHWLEVPSHRHLRHVRKACASEAGTARPGKGGRRLGVYLVLKYTLSWCRNVTRPPTLPKACLGILDASCMRLASSDDIFRLHPSQIRAVNPSENTDSDTWFNLGENRLKSLPVRKQKKTGSRPKRQHGTHYARISPRW